MAQNHINRSHHHSLFRDKAASWFLLTFFMLLITLITVTFFISPQDKEFFIPDTQAVEPPGPLISFTFDDGFADTYAAAAPVLAEQGLKGVVYVSTGCIDREAECMENVGGQKEFMTWEQLAELQNTYKWEVGSHTVNHRLLSTLTKDEKETELLGSKEILSAKGFSVTNFASPFGDYDYETLAISAKYYTSHRAFKDQKNNMWPYNNTVLQVKQVQGTVSTAEIKRMVDEAIDKNYWLILVFHEIKDNASPLNEAYEFGTEDLKDIAAYVKIKQDSGLINAVTVQEALQVRDENLLKDGDFARVFPPGWITDSTQNVGVDTKNGSYPTAENSVRLTADGKSLHLYTPRITVEPETTYVMKAYVNALERQSGDLGFYADEYDSRGKWLSGKWLGSVNGSVVTHLTANYMPSSVFVQSVQLQTYWTANPKGYVYVDNYEFYKVLKN